MYRDGSEIDRKIAITCVQSIFLYPAGYRNIQSMAILNDDFSIEVID